MTTPLFRIVLATLIVCATVGTAPASAAGYVGLEVSNHGVSVGFGTSNWGIWGSSWSSGGWSGGFSATLSGYGDWVHVGGLGQVWRPWVAAGWQPYSHGRWVWTSLGWTWVAYEPWGWVPHHYGNWAFTTVGWVWSPGYVYHPGNVVWMSSGAHVGWIPCAPRGWSHFHRTYDRGWRDGYAWGHQDGYSRGYEDGWRDARYATWVPRSRVTADNISHHAVGHETATHAVARSRVTPMAGPPSRAQVEGQTGRPVPEARINERQVSVDGRSIRMVRPEGQEGTVRRQSEATVQRALTPTARDRVVNGAGSQARSTTASTRSTRKHSEASSSQPSGTRSVRTEAVTPHTNSRARSASAATIPAPRTTPERSRAIAPVRSTSPSTPGSNPVRAARSTVPSKDLSRSRARLQKAPATSPPRRSTQKTEPAATATARSGTRSKATTVEQSRRANARKETESDSEKTRRSRRARN